MKITAFILSSAVILSLSACTCNSEKSELVHAVKVAEAQLTKQAEDFDGIEGCPRSIKDGALRIQPHDDWTCGFFPGSLWLCYELTGKEYFREQAEKYTARLSDIPALTNTHDLGFMVFCSYGKEYLATGNEAAKEAVIQASESLCTRFHEEQGLIRSWDFGVWNYPVIIDNMMNLEMLFWASEQSGNPRYREIAIKHADKTLANHFREDASSYHVVSYNDDGTVECRQTFQGYAHESAWSRGQAWGLYGFLVCYRCTGDEKYLEQAKRIASFIMNNPTLPKDKVPYWDYMAPGTTLPVGADSTGMILTPRGWEPARDASAAAVAASAFVEMSQLTEGEWSERCLKEAGDIISSLCSKEYLAKPGTNCGFILKHSTGAASLRSEIDTPLNYADYYLLEAIARYSKAKGITLN